MSNNKAQVLVIDDEPDIREILRTILEDAGFKCTVVASVDEALAELSAQEFDLAFTDIRMPGRPVSDLLQEFKRSHPLTVVIMITGLNTAETAMETIRMGAFDYIVKPFNLSEVLVAADRAMEKRRLDQANREFQKYLEEMAEDRAAQTSRLFYSITQILIRLLELRTPLDVGHSVNVAEIARHVALELKMTKDGIRKVYLAALLHDVGMITIEDLLLQKRGSLTTEEYRQIQEHSAVAENVLKPILDDGEVLKYIRHHHERYDGAGYPDGLKGNIIPLGARIIAVAEAFDAMTRSRPYRKALAPKLALAELLRCADSQFDPQVVAVFSRIFEHIAPNLQPSVPSQP
ncbi:MAG: response regulator [Acidobacteriia bacterium]|nr:response regulator [Terriglobia bacterium]